MSLMDKEMERFAEEEAADANDRVESPKIDAAAPTIESLQRIIDAQGAEIARLRSILVSVQLLAGCGGP